MTIPAPSASDTDPQQLPAVHDVVIVGAGPAGLAVAARLRERTPSALYTDEEHRRFHWLAKHAGRSAVKDKRTGRVHHPAATRSCERGNERGSGFQDGEEIAPGQSEDLLVLDSEGGGWMGKWRRLFGLLGIEGLRSPMFFHPHPGDRDALRAYAHERGREGELRELGGCVGRERSKHSRKCRKGGAKMKPSINERERDDYFAPSAALFEAFCQDLISRYRLDESGLVQQARVGNIEYGSVPQLEQTEDLFTLDTDTGTRYARAVVLAVGPGETPHVPPPFTPCRDLEACTTVLATQTTEGLIPPFSPLAQKIKSRRPTNVVVIGGGLTSAQVSDLCVRKGASRVWHLMRRPLKVKPFDVDLEWMGKFRNQEKAAFWMADGDGERAEMLAAARGGGSVTPLFAKILQKHVGAGRLALHTNTTVASASYDSASGTWNLATSPPISELPPIDHVFLATGSSTPFASLPYLQALQTSHPLESVAGLPVLTDDLQWSEDVPLFVTGKFAGLRLGPGAGNLEGARAGAERVVLALEERGMSGREGSGEERRDSGYGQDDDSGRKGEWEERGMERYAGGGSNRFEMFGHEGGVVGER